MGSGYGYVRRDRDAVPRNGWYLISSFGGAAGGIVNNMTDYYTSLSDAYPDIGWAGPLMTLSFGFLGGAATAEQTRDGRRIITRGLVGIALAGIFHGIALVAAGSGDSQSALLQYQAAQLIQPYREQIYLLAERGMDIARNVPEFARVLSQYA
ncbi:MAG: hypothetical protein NDI94_00915 [Candidatus Woesearchaeota archaeon]|nr:hypothetical protein [Candidatus Woesearchaeota archaeon]